MASDRGLTKITCVEHVTEEIEQLAHGSEIIASAMLAAIGNGVTLPKNVTLVWLAWCHSSCRPVIGRLAAANGQ
jgi:hypothetical protein